MSVAENPTTEPTTRSPQQELALGSLIGAVAILASLALVFAALPFYWHLTWVKMWADSQELRENLYLADALLLMIETAVVAVLIWGAYSALQTYSFPTLRAGIFCFTIYLFLVLCLIGWLSGELDQPGRFNDNAAAGWAILAVVLVAFVAGAGYLYLVVPGWTNILEGFEYQGWFHGAAYKGNQGVRVRRGTIVGVLAVGVTGIASMWTHRFFGYERTDQPNDWVWTVPFTNQTEIINLMFKMHIYIPIILVILLIWVAWRIVNIPVFADFLIATEAEMNKVSWTTRSRLFQDTVVVLTTVFLFTMFLFVVDIIWIKVLSAPYIQVLLIDPREAAQKQQEVAKW